jgi:hypothetical protein
MYKHNHPTTTRSPPNPKSYTQHMTVQALRHAAKTDLKNRLIPEEKGQNGGKRPEESRQRGPAATPGEVQTALPITKLCRVATGVANDIMVGGMRREGEKG